MDDSSGIHRLVSIRNDFFNEADYLSSSTIKRPDSICLLNQDELFFEQTVPLNPQSLRTIKAIKDRESLAVTGRNNYKITPTVKIPHILMQTWKTKEVPEHWQESPQSVAQHMSSWQYILMTDEDNDQFCQKYFPDFLNKFRNFPHNIQRADAIRYLFLYVHGGIYMDLDLVIVKPLDPLFYQDAELYLCSSGNIGSCLTNSFMASKPGCGLWLKMVEYMSLPAPWWCFGSKHLEVMNTTGPIALNYVVKENKYSYLALPSKLVMPCSVCNIDDCKIGDAYLKPLVGSSWISWDTKVMNFFMCNYKIIIIIAVLLIILLLIWLFVFRKKSNEKIIVIDDK